jgi:hypothetical protein
MGFEDNLSPSTSLKWVGFSFSSLLLTATLSLLLLLFYFFFPQLPTLFPPGKGPFASLAWVLTSTTSFVTLAEKRGSILILPFTLH